MMKNKRGWINVVISIVPYFLIVFLFQYFGAAISGSDLSKMDTEEFSMKEFFVINLTGLIGTILALWLLKKFVDKNRFDTLGFYKKNIRKDILLGLLFGFVIMLLGFLILTATRQLMIDTIRFDAADLLLTTAIYIIVAFAEEMYFRGYVLNNLMLSFNKYIALVLSALFFAIVHTANPDFTIWSFVGIFIAGLFLGLSYIFTKNLWFPIALHFSWNFFQSFFGFNVSGMDTYSLFTTRYKVENIWNGGRFGFESSMLGFLFQVAAILFVYWLFNKREKGVNKENERISEIN